MLNKLNYYSRYNRIKSPKEIQTLYHLLQDLNLDAIVTDDLIERVSYLREGHCLEREREGKRRFEERGGNGDRDGRWGDSEEGRRVASCERDGSERGRGVEGERVVENLRINTTRDPQKMYSKQASVQNRTERVQKSERQPSKQSNPKSSHRNDSKARTPRQVSIHETKSITQNVVQPSNQPNSPIDTLEPPLQPQPEPQPDPSFSQAEQIQTNLKEPENPKTSNFGDEWSQGLAQLRKIDEMQLRNSSYCKNQEEEVGDGDGGELGCRSEKLYRLYESDFQIQGSENQDNIIGDAYEHQEGNEIYIQEQMKQDAKGVKHQDEEGEDEHEESSEVDTEEQQRRRKQMTSIDNRITNARLGPPEHGQQPSIVKIPSKGFSQGKWPIGPTQKSIEGTVHDPPASSEAQPQPEAQISLVPSTLIQNSSILIEKQRKPFKKMMMDRKLNPRMATSTIVNDVPVPVVPAGPVKKVNFKKAMKKESQNKMREVTPQGKKIREFKQPEERKQLLQAFFDQN